MNNPVLGDHLRKKIYKCLRTFQNFLGVQKCLYVCYTMDKIQEKKTVSVCYTPQSKPYSVEKSLARPEDERGHTGWRNVI
jgi:hypothetical protein